MTCTQIARAAILWSCSRRAATRLSSGHVLGGSLTQANRLSVRVSRGRSSSLLTSPPLPGSIDHARCCQGTDPRCELPALWLVEVADAGPPVGWGQSGALGVRVVAALCCCTRRTPLTLKRQGRVT